VGLKVNDSDDVSEASASLHANIVANFRIVLADLKSQCT
jgi:hypothetical protein